MLFCSPRSTSPRLPPRSANTASTPRWWAAPPPARSRPGHRRGSIIGVSFDAEHFVASVKPIERLCDFEIAAGFAAARALLAEQELLQQRLETPTPSPCSSTTASPCARRRQRFGAALGHVPLVGGSAGVSPTVREPNMFLDDGCWKRRLMLLISTDHDFRVFQTRHFKPLDLKVVVTKADPANRLVMEINAGRRPGVCALLGLRRDDLTPQVFAAHPLVVRAGGRHYARAIQQVNETTKLPFLLRDRRGIVLSIAATGNLWPTSNPCSRASITIWGRSKPSSASTASCATSRWSRARCSRTSRAC
jgi:hypothetical protein